jgi:hypothetical protein
MTGLAERGFHVLEGRLANGSEVNLWGFMLDERAHAEELSYEVPERPAALYPTERWRRYFHYLRGPSGVPARAPFFRYMCERWARVHPQVPLREIRLVMVQGTIPPPHDFRQRKEPLTRVINCEASCPAARE